MHSTTIVLGEQNYPLPSAPAGGRPLHVHVHEARSIPINISSKRSRFFSIATASTAAQLQLEMFLLIFEQRDMACKVPSISVHFNSMGLHDKALIIPSPE